MRTSLSPLSPVREDAVVRPNRIEMDLAPLGPQFNGETDPLIAAVRTLARACRALQRRARRTRDSLYEQDKITAVHAAIVQATSDLYDARNVEAVRTEVIESMRVEIDLQVLESLSAPRCPVQPQPAHEQKPGKQHTESWAQRQRERGAP